MILPLPFYQDHAVTLYHGDCREVLPLLPEVDMLLTDPPYSSGGMFRGDRAKAPEVKYSKDSSLEWETFSGDTMDQRACYRWGVEWMGEVRKKLKAGAYAVVFTDWRQLPLTSDYYQAAGLVWRGIINWDKGLGSRAPHKGYFRHQAEYAIWGTNGECQLHDDGPFPGVFQEPIRQADKFHMTGKPTPLIKAIARASTPAGIILDPFAGSGTTLVAAKHLGRRAIGIELSEKNCRIAAERAAQESLAI